MSPFFLLGHMVSMGMQVTAQLLIIGSLLIFHAAAVAVKPAKVGKLESKLQKVQELVLGGQRELAIKALDELKEQSSSEAERKEIQETRTKVANIFLTDKGQKLFEMGQSLVWTNAKQAKASLQEALEVEAGNIQIRLSLARIFLLESDCRKAQEQIDASKAVDPADEHVTLLLGQSLLCAGEKEKAINALKQAEKNIKDNRAMLNYLFAKISLQQGQLVEAKNFADLAKKEDPSFPEAYEILWRISRAQEKAEDILAEKYVTLCKEVNLKLRKRYQDEPMLCSQALELGAELGKKTTETVDEE